MISSQVTVNTTAQRIITKSNAWRTIYIHVVGAGVVYIGGSDVTSSNGLLTEKNAVPLAIELPAQEELWAVTGSGTEDLRIMKPLNYGE